MCSVIQDLFTKVLCSPMLEAPAIVVVGSKKSESGTMIDRDMRRRMNDGCVRRIPSH